MCVLLLYMLLSLFFFYSLSYYSYLPAPTFYRSTPTKRLPALFAIDHRHLITFPWTTSTAPRPTKTLPHTTFIDQRYTVTHPRTSFIDPRCAGCYLCTAGRSLTCVVFICMTADRFYITLQTFRVLQYWYYPLYALIHIFFLLLPPLVAN